MTATDVLVGSYTQGSSKGIYRLAFDSQTGKLDPTPRQVIASENPSWLTLSPDQRHLFVVNENGPGQADVVGKVSSFAIDAKTHQVTPINQVESRGDEPTHSSLSADQRFLFVANYAVQPKPGGVLAVIPVGKDGKLSPVAQTDTHPASHVDAERQASSHVHSAVPTPDGKYLVASDLGADRLFVYQYDGQQQQPLKPAKVASVELPPGSGPRHLLFSKDGKHAWLTLEMAAQVAVFEYKDGTFKQTQQVDLKGEAQKNGGGGLHASPDGRFLYVANRGDANQLLVFAIDAASGKLKEIQRRSVEGKEPREFSFDPSGRFVLIANQKSNQIVTVRRDPATGLLGETVQALAFDSPSDFHFLDAK
jgi:6-phosphogluconolactonase (cycloisomerase 2 family)